MKVPEKLNQWLNDKQKQKYLFAAFVCGLCLMLLPTAQAEEQTVTDATGDVSYSVETEEERLEKVLSSIRGAGKCKVLLSVRSGAQLILAEDEGETVVISNSGRQSTVTVQKRYPDYMGAVIVAEGGGNATVRYDILSAVMSYTGLGADKITICSLEE